MDMVASIISINLDDYHSCTSKLTKNFVMGYKFGYDHLWLPGLHNTTLVPMLHTFLISLLKHIQFGMIYIYFSSTLHTG